MEGIVKKRISIWLFIAMLVLTSFSGFNSQQPVQAAELDQEVTQQPIATAPLNANAITKKPKLLSDLPFQLEANTNQNAQPDQPQQLVETGSAATPAAETQQTTTAPPQPTASLPFPQHISDWILDKEAGYIYAIAKSTNKLYFINKETLTIEKELFVGSMPTDVYKFENKLYIALNGATMIQTVDLQTKELAESIPLAQKPHRLTVTPTHIIYSADSSDIFSYNRMTNLSTRISFSTSSPVIEANNDNRTVFIGETGSSGSDFMVYDYINNQFVGFSNYDDGYGFGFPYHKILMDEDSVYFGGHRMNKANISEFHGAYMRLGDYSYLISKIMDVSSQYVLTDQAIFDKHTYLKLADLPFEPQASLIDDDGTVYILQSAWYQSGPNDKIHRYTLPLTTPEPLQVEKRNEHAALSNYPITDWATDEEVPYVYIVSAETNELMVLRKSDLSIANSMWIGSRPTDVEVHKGKVYVAFRGETHIAEFNVADSENITVDVTRHLINTFAHKIIPFNGKVIFSGEEEKIHVLFENGEIKKFTQPWTVYNKYYLDINEQILYVGGPFDIYKLDPLTQTTLLTADTDVRISYGGNVFKDGDSLYYGLQRMNATDLTTIYGTYPEYPIYAKGELVFSSRSVFDRDTYTKTMALPFEVSKITVHNDGTILLSSGQKLYRFESLAEMDEYILHNILPSAPILLDTNHQEGVIDGYIAFKPAEENQQVKHYNAYYLDKDGNKLKKINMHYSSTLEDGTFLYELWVQEIIPQGAVSIGLFPYLKLQEKEYEQGSIGELWDTPTYIPQNFAMNDQNNDPTKFTGTVTWQPGKREPANATYELYFFNEAGEFNGPLNTVATGQASYSVTLTNVNVPTGAVGMVLILQKDNGMFSPFYPILVFPELQTPKLSAQQISIVSNRTAADVVTVTSVQAGDIIRVYDELEMYLIGQATVPANQTFVSLNIGEIGAPGQKISVSRETPDLYESEGILVTIPNYPSSPPPSGGGGGGGGSAPPPVIMPPVVTNPPGGGTTAPPAKPEQPATPAPTLEEKVIDQNGKKVTVAEVSEDYAKYLVEQLDFQYDKRIVLKLENPADNAQFKLAEKTVKFISSQDKSATIEVQTSFGKINMPVAPLLRELNTKSGDQQITLAVEQAAGSYATKLKSQLKGATPVGKPVEFKVLSNGTELQKFDQYLEHVLTVDASGMSESELVGLTYNPTTGTYVPVPAKFSFEDGVLTASLYRKGNSVYTIVKNKVTLKDLPKTAQYKESIQKLANRTVISGFNDGTFKPEQSVTRAEFAKMLNRALGIQAVKVTKSQFKDVKSSNWFQGDVEAAVKAGLIKGFADGTYRPNQKITHKEMIVMVTNALRYVGAEKNLDSSVAVPKDVPSWAKQSYIEAVSTNIVIEGKDAFTFKASKTTNRQESALLIYRMLLAVDYIN